MNVAENPFLALRPFTRKDAPRFFGRDADLVLVKSRLVSARTTLLFAASGVGKSSFINAKLVPAVEPQWLIVTHRSWATGPPLEAVRRRMAEEAAGLGLEGLPLDQQAVRLIASTSGTRGWLLILDQFEEVFQHWRDTKPLDDLAAEIARLVHTPGLEARVLISMREEFLGELSIFDNLIPDLFNNCYRLKNPTRAEAEDIIIRTALTRKVETGPGLEPLVDDLARAASHMARPQSEPSVDSRLPMPFLQIVCYRLWERQMVGPDGSLRAGTFLNTTPGSVRTELEQYCREKLNGLTDRERDLAAAAFGYLMTRSGAKMAYPLDVLAEQAGVEEGPLLAVLQKLAAEDVRILRDTPGGSGSQPWFELYHDVYARFLSDWKRERDALREQRRSSQRKKVVAAAVLASAVLSGAVMWIQADRERTRARSAANRQRAANLLQVAQNERTPDGYVTGLSLRFAVESLVRHPSEEARAFLREALRTPAVEIARLQLPGLDRFSISPDGRVLCEVVKGGISLSRLPGNEPIGFVPQPVLIAAVAFSPDGATVAAGGYDGKVMILSATDATIVQSIDVIDDGQVTALAYGPRGLLAVAAEGGSRHFVNVYSTSNPTAPGAAVEHAAPVSVVAFSPNQEYLLSGDASGKVIVRTLGSREEKAYYHAKQKRVLAVAFRPDARMFASSSEDGVTTATVLSGGVWQLSRPSTNVASALAFSPESRFLATGQGWLWEFAIGSDAPPQSPGGQPLNMTGLTALAFSPDERMLAVAGEAGAFLIETNPIRMRMRLNEGERVDNMLLDAQGRWMAIKVRDTLRMFRLTPGDNKPETDAELEESACALSVAAASGRLAGFLGQEKPLGCRDASR